MSILYKTYMVKKTNKEPTLSRREILAIAGEAEADPRTVASIYDGQRSKWLVRERVIRAAEKLGLKAPPSEGK